ncbi:hypothetical protein AKJ64_03750 [candidate division MSBL1 archaeon SCGC-AAA259E17]|uniref:Uncharacterized protein n=1 Tax=candidate division MSBL1 archaeon SCGC-AAA259E17 TaxID=1698263 RepID=A0A133UDD5_9EURY|nr:hypothetical protein AKJ64_03750 [candidate division MSBL1 archaeon SCGC-AAA259E17]
MIWRNKSGGASLRNEEKAGGPNWCIGARYATRRLTNGIWAVGQVRGPRLLCPGNEYEEHDELESILERYDGLEALFDLYNSIDRRKAQEMNELRQQIDLLGGKVEELRKKFSEGVDDVEGVDPDAQVKSFYPSTRYAGEKKSLGQ